ncbi:IS1/IS1595 family N-terminal zinc-binding domain-containing protein [Baaleninema simplex]
MLMICPQCGSEDRVKNGHTYYGKQRFKGLPGLR